MISSHHDRFMTKHYLVTDNDLASCINNNTASYVNITTDNYIFQPNQSC